MEVPSFLLYLILIILGHRVGGLGEKEREEEKNRDRIFSLSKKVLSSIPKNSIVLRGVNNDLSVFSTYGTEKAYGKVVCWVQSIYWKVL